ncbi:hypothetical protein [Actinomyces trachealis]|uniref:hypothetical protein n=1 Tax=Actinomyces trachealis TaxID=2763540 RepID=UPI001892B32A|nr:hypothetical protein [Actinomyces trachealis]
MNRRRRSQNRLVRWTVMGLALLIVLGIVLTAVAPALATPRGEAIAAMLGRAGTPTGLAAPSSTGLTKTANASPAIQNTSAAPTAVATPNSTVLLGTHDLTWADVLQAAQDQSQPQKVRDAANTLLAKAGVNEPTNVVTRTVGNGSCPADGWLGIGAGTRLSANAKDSQDHCGWPASWQQASAKAPAPTARAALGILRETLDQHEASSGAVGRGAALALTDAKGTPPAEFAVKDLTDGAKYPQLLLVDTADPAVMAQLLPETFEPGSVATAPSTGVSSVSTDAQRLMALVAALQHVQQTGARAVVVSVADADSPGPQLGLLPAGTQVVGGFGSPTTGTLRGPGGAAEFLRFPATHQLGLMELSELTQSLVEACLHLTTLSMPEPAPYPPLLLASPSQVTPSSDTAQGQLAAQVLADQALHARAAHQATIPTSLLLIGTSLLATTYGACLLRAGANGAQRPCSPRPGAGLASAVPALLSPVGALTTNLLPWWRVGAHGELPGAATIATALAGTIAITAVLSALLLGAWRLLRGHSWSYAAVVAAAAALSLTATIGDGALGARLALNSPLGMSTVVAGRYYGVNNISFAMGAGAFLVLVLALWSLLRPRLASSRSSSTASTAAGHRSAAIATTVLVVVLGLPLLVADGAAFLGADVGGVLTLLPVLATLALTLAGFRLRWLHLAAMALAAAVVALGFAALDWLMNGHQPRSHLGRFLVDLRHGQAGGTLGRKAWALVAPFTTGWLPVAALLVSLAALTTAAWWLRRTVRHAQAGQGPYAWLAAQLIADSVEVNQVVPQQTNGIQSLARTRPATWPFGWLRPALITSLVLVAAEVTLNDSGLAMLWFSAVTLLPGLLALVCTTVMRPVFAADGPAPVAEAR